VINRLVNLNKFQGCLLGLAVGDALGCTLEFKKPGTFSIGGVTYWKGLERDIIIIINILDIQNLDINSLYVALSRAKLQFIILAQSKEIDALKNKIGLNPPNDMYRVKYKGIRREIELGIGDLKILK